MGYICLRCGYEDDIKFKICPLCDGEEVKSIKSMEEATEIKDQINEDRNLDEYINKRKEIEAKADMLDDTTFIGDDTISESYDISETMKTFGNIGFYLTILGAFVLFVSSFIVALDEESIGVFFLFVLYAILVFVTGLIHKTIWYWFALVLANLAEINSKK